ncbi:MAG: thiamine biosynthesis protein [Dissulfurimicrobium sp.]|uniref:thiamine biosynthesis protein n=1 Tax=Dissulfurimicrobium sp. TaxID=2022436 RepID=UPI003D0EEBEA
MRKNSSRLETICLLLYSGGLDSIIAYKILERQGLTVKALRFISPFFGHEFKNREDEARLEALEKYGIDLEIIDVSRDYLEILRSPRYGYGRYLNPCIDCKIFMVKQAIARLDSLGATFIATGEVVGQRPFSQRRDTINLIEKEAGAKGLILRPLSALNLPPTPMEKAGLVDRSRLLGISGRSRKPQIALAEEFGITDYPQPGGGCVLTDPILSKSIKRFIEIQPSFGPDDVFLAIIGRRFLFPDGSWLILGRNDNENKRIMSLLKKGDTCLCTAEGTGPLGLWQKMIRDDDMAPNYERWYERHKTEVENIFSRYAKRGRGVLFIEISRDKALDLDRLSNNERKSFLC